MAGRLFLLILAVTAELSLTVTTAGAVGVNWGTEASHPLPPSKVVELLKSNGIAKVKLFDADPKVLRALSGSNIGVAVGIPNSMIKSLNASRKVAESWVHDNVTRYFNGGNRVRIEYVAVGDEPFHQSYGNQYRPFVIGAAMNIQNALAKASLGSEVKVVVPSSFDSFLSESGRPSLGHFRADLNKTMIELLSFLTKHHSPFFVTISPFLSFHQNKNISLDFSLFKETAQAHKDRRKTYRNSYDLSYDTLASALSSIGFSDVDIVVSKIGWPTDGAANATSPTAEVFLKGLMAHLEKKTGSLLRPPVETYIGSLLDEDQRNISSGNFERHWGVFTFDGQAKYGFSFNHNSKKLVNAQNVQYLPPKWCVVNNNKDLSNVSAKALEACAVADCTSILPGGTCSGIGWPGNVSYAFNSLYQQNDHSAESCDFGGLGLITTVDPSEDNCRFSVQLDTSHSSSQIPHFFQSWLLLLLFLLSVPF
ncbi:PREDICTED: LOW QUALITY PROTEIN: glucan endo-1,3-beta-glucosidase 9 [Camelina sativa]|uniref:glucan endo-1,3-beta-D-glucosidase n=1 Tax=Camelina sativa TaxID=90675 RepID=A0ABM0VBJ4_CAMSA|nr:PREDICTED: LOW QUALITY PROTEIN: glucan endo-1,3-beta-glucosidase 9 [Camelina sativa]